MDALTVPATLESLDPVVRYVLAAANAAGLDKKASYNLRLAVDEIATNIITHGYEEAGMSGDLVVRADLDDQMLTVVLEDSAPPFDPREKEDPDHLDKPLHDRPIGGLGVFLVLKSVDEFRYTYEDNKNKNILVMKRPSSASADGGAKGGA